MNQKLKILLMLGCLLAACDSGGSGTGITKTDTIPPREATDPVPEPPDETESNKSNSQTGSQPNKINNTPQEELYRITGTEPFWSLTLSKPYSTYRSMEGDSITFPYQAPTVASGRPQDLAQLYKLGAGDWVLLRGGNSPCSDGMSDREWKYTATLWLNGQLHDGCGEKLKK